MPTGNGENLQTVKNSISLDSRFVDLENTGERATLILTTSLTSIWVHYQVSNCYLCTLALLRIVIIVILQRVTLTVALILTFCL